MDTGASTEPSGKFALATQTNRRGNMKLALRPSTNVSISLTRPLAVIMLRVLDIRHCYRRICRYGEGCVSKARAPQTAIQVFSYLCILVSGGGWVELRGEGGGGGTRTRAYNGRAKSKKGLDYLVLGCIDD